MSLAHQQGILFASQVAQPSGNDLNGGPPGVGSPVALAELLHAPAGDWPAFQPAAFEPIDGALDATQREAVARALATPDLCLIQGPPGTGKSRVAAEIIGQVVRRGQRVLLLAASPAAVDGVLERLAGCASVSALRCLGPGEESAGLPPWARRLTLAERQRFFEEQTLGGARTAAAAARQRLQQRRADEAVWPPLRQLAQRQQELAAAAEQLTQRRADLAAAVEAEAQQAGSVSAAGATPFQARLKCWQQEQDDARARADAQRAQKQAEADKTRAEQAAVAADRQRWQPLAQARQGKRWWSFAFWRALLVADLAAKLETLERRTQELARQADKLDADLADLAAQRSCAEQQARAEAERLRQDEVARRQAQVDRELTDLQQRQEALDADWDQAAGRLAPGTQPPDARSPDAVAAAQDLCRQRLHQDEQEEQRASHWLAGLEQTAPGFTARLAGCVNLVASATAGLAGDPLFGDTCRPPALFDLLILDEAEHVTESEFLALARRARHWVLLGCPALPGCEGEQGAPPRVVRPAGVRTGFFAPLWRHLHPDLRQLPYVWLQRQGRLQCRLHPTTPEQQRWIQSERVADRPDIELRILSEPRQPPRLVEVVFPAGVSIHQAKEYLFRELEELTIQAPGPGLRWLDRPGQVVLRLGPTELADARPVSLETGVRELVGRLPQVGPAGDGPAPWQTCCLEFDCAAGWDRGRAEGWLQKHLPLDNPGRTVSLGAPHRMAPGLGHWLAEVAFTGTYHCDDPIPNDRPRVEFVPVPPTPAAEPRRREDESRRRGNSAAAVLPRLRGSRGGAGLEVDLADARRIDQLPSELRVVLPGHGLVNYLEAQAVVRTVETLLADAGFQPEAARWHQQHAVAGCSARHPTLAIICLYAAQAELVRRLLRRVPLPAPGPIHVEVGLPGAFRQRECWAALVSLTRSHTHRAVSYGEGPETLAQALTRAAGRLILFGDPGTLARRSQWAEAVDHLDPAAAGRERQLIRQLVSAVQGAGPVPQVFRLHESGSI
jgi:hypothetical protein